MSEVVEWARLVRGKDSAFREIAVQGRTVVVRKGTTQSNARLKTLPFSTDDQARSHAAELITKGLKKGFEKEKPVRRPLPGLNDMPAAKAAVRRGWQSALAPLRTRYRNELKASGLNGKRTFFAQAKPPIDANDLARKCLSAAESAFGIEFARALFDGHDHGTGGWPVPDQEYAAFYLDPQRVAKIAELRLRGHLRVDDGPSLKPEAPRRNTARRPSAR